MSSFDNPNQLPKCMFLAKNLFSTSKKHIADGASASVFYGRYNDTKVCIKQYKSTVTESEILNEAKILCSLPASEYFCFIVGICLDTPRRLVTSFFGSDFPIKNTLDYSIRSKEVSLAHSISIMSKLLCGISLLHQHNIFHGDLKPNNILVMFVNSSVHLKIIDFGCSSLISNFNERTFLELVENEEKKLICRCNRHTAPEVHYGYPRSKYSDIYGAGYCFSKLFSIHPVLAKHKNLVSTMKRCENLDPYSRPSLSEIVQALDICRIK